MTSSEIKGYLKEGEGLHLEFKEATNSLPRSLFDSVCAFLNTDGGTILLGVSDSGKVVGVDPEGVDTLLIDLANLSNNPQKLSPPYLLFPESIEIRGKTVIAVQIPLSSQLHRHNGNVFLRSEDGDYRVQGMHQLAGLLNRKLGIFSEQRVFPHAERSDLRPELFEKARRLMLSRNHQHPWGALDDDGLIEIGGFVGKDPDTGRSGYTLACLLLFGSDHVIQSVAPGYKFDCLLRRKDTERYDDRLTIRTNLIEAYEQMMGFVDKHLNDPFYLEGDMSISLRERVFREVISNLICHREYTNAAPATFCIYNDRVEVKNPNVPHHFGELTPDTLKPFPKNPSICKFMIQIGRFDELGSGMRNLAHYLPLYSGGAVPAFREEGMVFVSDLPLVSEEGQPQSAEGMSGNSSCKTSGKASCKTAETIVSLLARDPGLTIPAVASHLGITARAVASHIAQLKHGKVLARVGGRKGGQWKVLQPGEPERGIVSEERAIHYASRPEAASAEMSGKTSCKAAEMSGKILELLAGSPQLTLPEAATLLDVSTRTVERHVATLKQQGRLTRAGSRKDGRWEVVE